MPKAIVFTAFLSVLILTGATGAAMAQSKYMFGAGWPPEHWENQGFRPYMEPPKLTHNSQWDYDDWKSSDWLQQKDSKMHLINGFYNADILRNQYMDDDMPVLEIGPNFYNLGGHDKRRITQMVDETFNITGDNLFGSFMLYDWQSKDPIGVYTQYGLQLK